MAVSREVASYQGQQEIVEAINGFTLSGVAQKAVWFDSVSSMQRADIPAGATAATRGYYTVNDGGNAFYYIREKAQSDVEDGIYIIFLDNENVAELISKKSAPAASRPTAGIVVGYMIFDTTLEKPIWAKAINGNVVTWVDATGTVV